MKKLLILCFLLSCICSLFAQTVRPDQFTEKTTPVATDEIYSQAGGTSPVRITFQSALKYFGADIATVGFVPTATGNTTNKNQFVTDPAGDIWFIDQNGDAVKIDDSSAANLTAVLTAGNNAGALKITNLANPTAAQDAATKTYVDDADSILLKTYLSDTSTITSPKMGNIMLNGTVDTMAIRSTKGYWHVFTGGGGGGGIGGSGAANQIAKFSAATTLTGTNDLWDDGTEVRINRDSVGVGRLDPSYAVDVFSDMSDIVRIEGSGNDANILFHNGFTGNGAADGAQFGLSTADFFLNNRATGGSLFLSTEGNQRFRINSNGSFRFNAYGAGTHTGTLTKLLGVTTLGDVIEVNAASGNIVDGTGTANRVAYWTGASTIAADDDFFFDGTNVGVGTTSPAVRLGVNSGAATDIARFQSTGTTASLHVHNATTGTVINTDGLTVRNIDNDAGVWNYENGYLRFGTNNTERVRILSTGEVGIGTIAPATLLHVDASAGANVNVLTVNGPNNGSKISIQNTGSERMRIGTTGSGGSQGEIIFSGSGSFFLQQGGGANIRIGMRSDQSLTFHNYSGTEVGRFHTNGNYGINNNAPAVRLDVNSATDTDIARFQSTGTTASLHLHNATTGTVIGTDGLTIRNIGNDAGVWNYENGYLRFATNNTERARFDASGLFGINQTTVAYRLDVKQETAGGHGIRLQSTNTLAYQLFHNTASGTTNTDGLLIGEAGNVGIIRNQENADLSIGTDNSEDLVIKTGGNVGIATNTPSEVLDVAGDVRFRERIYDSNNDPGSSGQILMSTATGTDWIDTAGLGNNPAAWQGHWTSVTGIHANGDTLDFANLSQDFTLGSGITVSSTGDSISLAAGSYKLIARLTCNDTDQRADYYFIEGGTAKGAAGQAGGATSNGSGDVSAVLYTTISSTTTFRIKIVNASNSPQFQGNSPSSGYASSLIIEKL